MKDRAINPTNINKQFIKNMEKCQCKICCAFSFVSEVAIIYVYLFCLQEIIEDICLCLTLSKTITHV